MNLLNTKKLKVPIFIIATLCIMICSAIIFISRALYMQDGVEIVPELKGGLKLVKYLNYENEGKEASLIEFDFKEKIGYNNNYYSPVTDNSVYIQMPKIANELPSKVEVITISSKATNGKNTQSGAESEYNRENGILHISAKNEADEHGDIYYGKSSDYDEYSIIAYYEDKIEFQNDEDKTINIPITVQYQSLNKEIGFIEGKFNQEIVLEEKGELICSEIKTGNVYNGYINSNISSGTKYETEFTQNVTMYVDYLDVDEITFEEVNAFKNENNEINISKNINTKKISINKSDVLRIFGDEGNLQLISESGDILLDVNKDTVEENNEVIFSLENISDNVFIKTSKPINKGLIRISVTKAISAEMVDLNNKYVVTGQRVIGKKTIEVDNEETPKEYETENITESVSTDYTEIQEAITKVNIGLDNKEWTNSVQNNVNFVATFVNSNEKYNLFKNPSLEVILPENVEKVVLGESYLLNANGLSIENIESIEKEDGKKAIVAKLQGVQTEYLFDNMIDGTKIVIPATIILEKEFESNTNNVTISYNNEVGNTNKNGSKQIAVSLISEIEQQNNDTTVNNEPIENIDLEGAKLQNNQQDEKLKLAANVSKVQELKENGGLSINAVATVGENVIARAGTNETTNVQNGIAYERQVIKYEVTITNNTEETLSDISVIGGIPSYTKYATIDHGTYWDMEITYDYVADESVTNYKLESISTLNPGETKIDYYEVLVDDLENNLNNISTSNNITVKVSDEEYDTYILSNKISQAELDIKLKSTYNREGDDTFAYQINVTNLTDSDFNNIYVETSNIPKELTFEKSIVMYAENASGNGKIEDNKFKINIDSLESGATRMIWLAFAGENYDDKVNEVELKMSANALINDVTYQSNENRITAYPQYVTATMTLDKEGQEVHYQDDLTYTVTIKNESKVKSLINVIANLPKEIDGIKAEYFWYDLGENLSTEYDIEAERNIIYSLIKEEIDLSTNTVDGDGKDEDEDEDEDSDNILVGDQTADKEEDDDINIAAILPAGKSITITIKAKAGYVDKDTVASNFVTVKGNTIPQVNSNVTTVTILTDVDWDYISKLENSVNGKNNENAENNEDTNNENENENGNDNNNMSDNSTSNSTGVSTGDSVYNDDKQNINDKQYSISGLVWLDENEDGRRTSDERRITDATVKIYNAENNSIVILGNNKLISKVDENGEYIFNNIPNGRYYCLFEYDTENYEVTTYQKSGVASSLNNDATKTEVNMNGVVKNIAITDVLVVNNNNLTNIDLGLVENTKFDLKLEKYISKVTVNDQEKNREYTYDNTSLAKVEIASKYIEGAVVTIEYKFVVTNEGNITGYANEITDYLPEELSFSENSNNGWSLGKDGYLRNTALTAKPIAVGESKILTLILTKTMTKDSTGTIKNSAEITQSSNLKNSKEIDIENNADYAEIIISVKTGIYKNMTISLLIIIALSGIIFIIKKYNKKLPTILMVITLMILLESTMSNVYGYYITIWWTSSGLYGSDNNYWYCTQPGNHQCAQHNHYYSVSVTTDTLNNKTEVLKELTLTSSGEPQFNNFDNKYKLVGPYTVECNYRVSSATITAKLKGADSYTICDSKGEKQSWPSKKKKFTFYLKVPIETSAVTKVTVKVTVAKVKKVTTIKRDTYYATCIGVGSYHENSRGIQTSTSADGTQDARRSVTTTSTEYKDGTKKCTFSSVSEGSIQILKKDAATGNEIKANSGAEFTIKDSNGNIVETEVEIGELVRDISPGTYTITETKAPSGYKLELQSNITKTITVQSGSIATVNFENQKYTNLEIKKIDKSRKDVVEGIGFTVFDNHYKKYIDANGKQTDTKTTIYTGSDGIIHISNVLLYDTDTTFTVTEVASKNLYYKADTNIKGTITGKSNSSTTWSSITIGNERSYALTLIKKDVDDASATVNAKFLVKYENSGDVDNGKYLTSSGEYSTNKSEITTSGGNKTISGIKRGTYHVYEVGITTDRYKLEWQDNYDEQNKWIDWGTVEVNNENTKLEKTINNKKSYSLTLTKEDADKTDEVVDATFVVKFEKSAKSNDKYEGQWISADGVYSNTPTSITTTNGEAVIKYMKEGMYHIYETEINTSGYKLEWQDTYDATNKWVDLGTVEITGNDAPKLRYNTLDNHKYVRISGYVWQEQKLQTKTGSTYNNTYDSGRDSLLSNIPVELIEKSASGEKVIANDTTKADGSYEFATLNKVAGNPKIIYWDLYKYYIRFTYDKGKYVTVEVELSQDRNNVSRAQDETITTQELDDNYLIGKNGYAVTYKNATGEADGLTRYFKNASCYVEDVNLGLMEKYDPNFSIKEELDYIKVKMNGYTYTYKYGAGSASSDKDKATKIESMYVPTTSIQTLTGFYTAQIYPSDVAYNVESLKNGNGQKLQLYVVYKITVLNDETENTEFLYDEQKLYLNSLTNYFDEERYTVCNDENLSDEHGKDFSLWSNSRTETNNGNTYGVTNYDVDNANSAYKNGIKRNDGTGNDNNAVSSYIQFKMKDDALKAILEGDINKYHEEKVPTKTTANAYHDYLRTDEMWTYPSVRSWRGTTSIENEYKLTSGNKTAFTHHSVNKDASSYSLYVRIKLGSPRTISGKVFEDTATRNVLDANIGDGIYNNNENIAKNVKVELLNAKSTDDYSTVEDLASDNANIADLYAKDDTNPNHYKISKAQQVTKDDGKYEFTGIVPGLYYIRFTYGDGTQKIFTTSGTEVTSIIVNDYKSTTISDANDNTIVNLIRTANNLSTDDIQKYQNIILKKETGDEEAAKKALEWYKYIQNDNIVYSTATDDLGLRSTFNNNIYNKDGSIQNGEDDVKTMKAFTPISSISIENDTSDTVQINTYEDNNVYKNEYTRFNLGIIKVPNTVIVLEKKITNIELTAQVGSTIISGKPKEIKSPYFSDVDKATTDGSKYSKIEIDNETLYGSKLKTTYTITVKNETEKDYVDKDQDLGNYQNYADTTSIRPKNVTIQQIIDTIDEKYKFQNQESIGKDGNTITISFDNNSKKLVIEGWSSNGLSSGQDEVISYTVETLINTTNDDLLFNNKAEVTKIKLDKMTTLQSGFEWKEDKTDLTITPSTGKNNNTTYLIVGTISLVILSFGIVIIKKKVLEK